jgi:site-specific DNA-methyltransferase (cytosine-N4-specific)
MLKSNVIIVVSTGEIGPAAKGYANKVMGDSNLSIVLINRGDLKTIEANPAAIVDVFNREAAHAMKLKALDI